MESKTIQIFLLLFSLLSFSFTYNLQGNNQLYLGDTKDIPKTETLTQISYTSNSVKANVPDAYKFQKYELTFSNQGTIPNYIEVAVLNKKEGEPSPILSFSPKDQNAKESRLQLSKTPFTTNTLWIKKEQFQNLKFYVGVECQGSNQTQCGYTLMFSGYKEITFESMSSYKYYVSQNNTEMIFKFKNEERGDNNTVTFYATGGKNISLSLSNCSEETCKQFNFAEGSAITMKNKKINYYTLTVKAKAGYYITVGGKLIENNGESMENILEPEYGQLSGFLRKEFLEKECYLLPNTEKEKDVYYITGTLYNSVAEIKFYDKDMKLLQEDIQITGQGFFYSIYNSTNSKKKYICISFLDNLLLKAYYIPYNLNLL